MHSGSFQSHRDPVVQEESPWLLAKMSDFSLMMLWICNSVFFINLVSKSTDSHLCLQTQTSQEERVFSVISFLNSQELMPSPWIPTFVKPTRRKIRRSVSFVNSQSPKNANPYCSSGGQQATKSKMLEEFGFKFGSLWWQYLSQQLT